MKWLRRNAALVVLLLLGASTAYGFNQARYDREVGRHRTCVAFETLIEAASSNPSEPRTPEQEARQKAAVAAFQAQLRAKGIPIVDCAKLDPEYLDWPW